ncbi:MAG: HEAT repeat domain-containing protein [Bryobacteraceae bacterium]
MMCERVREQLPECLAGKLDKAERERVIGHLETCSGCRNELAELGIVWRGLESMSVPEPNRAMRTRFMEMMEAYQAGMEQAPPKRVEPPAETSRSRWLAWWPSQPAWQMAIACALLIAGVAAGRYEAGAPKEMSPEMAQLKGQVEGLRQLVALSLLQAQSPSDRLRGVSFSSQIARPDADVEQSLLRAVNHDPNVNVRLSAVDAIEKYTGDPAVRRALVDAVAVQDSPIVQCALIDLLKEINDRDSAPALRKLAQDGQVDEVVRGRATLAVHKLEGNK